MAYECVVVTHINASADDVWDWMQDVRNLLHVNMFHEDVLWDEPITEAGPRVPVPHQFGVVRQRRVAHIRDYRKYFIGFGETKAKDEPGQDAFPHYQSFEIAPLGDGTCVIANRLRGLYQFPGAKYIGHWIFRRWTPYVLEDDNATIAVAVGAMAPDDKPRPKGVLKLWPAIVLGGRILTTRSRRRIAKADKDRREREAAAKPGVSAASSAEAPARSVKA